MRLYGALPLGGLVCTHFLEPKACISRTCQIFFKFLRVGPKDRPSFKIRHPGKTIQSNLSCTPRRSSVGPSTSRQYLSLRFVKKRTLVLTAFPNRHSEMTVPQHCETRG